MGLRHAKRFQQILEDDFRLDADETGFATKELTFIQAEARRVEYAKTRIREFVPVDHSVPDWAMTWGYNQIDETGEAKIITHMSEDLPKVEVTKEQFTHRIHIVGAKYGYSVDELRAASRGINLERERAALARRVIERKIDKIGALGLPEAGLEGFINHSAITPVGGLNGAWDNPATTPDEILEDAGTVIESIPTNTLDNHEATDFIMPDTFYGVLRRRKFDNTSGKSILQTLQEAYPGVTFSKWNRLRDVDSGGERVIAYEKSSEVLRLVISMEYQELAPQAKDLMLNVPCWAKLGGVAVFIPGAIAFGDVA